MHIHQNYNAIGTRSSASTLTAAFSGTVGNTILAEGFKKASFDVTYTPSTTNAYAQLLFEYSTDDKMTTPTNWKPFTVDISSTIEVDVYAQKGTNMGTGSGSPINIPAPNTSTASQAVTCHVMPDTDLVATWIRVRAQENQAGGVFGTLFVGVSLQN